MTDPQDPEPRLLKTKIWYAPMAEKQLGWLEEQKKRAVLHELKHLPRPQVLSRGRCRSDQATLWSRCRIPAGALDRLSI